MSKLTPEQAWQHVKALYKDADGIEQGSSNQETVVRMGQYQRPLTLYRMNEIDWPEGMDRYPPPEPQYREPTQADVGKMVEVRYNDVSDWSERMLIAILPSHYPRRFLCQSDVHWQSYCDWLEARIAVDEPQAKSPRPSRPGQVAGMETK